MKTSVWSTLSAVDCSKNVEKKGQLTYLSWTWAWATLMEYYPASTFEFQPESSLDDGTVMVSCTVTVEGMERKMWLPVMDNRNNAVKNPDTRKISDARMRCLVKAIALHGLGLYIYAGEDLPQSAQEERDAVLTADQLQALNAALDSVEADKIAFCKLFSINSLAEMKAGQLDKANTMIERKRKSLEVSNAKS